MLQNEYPQVDPQRVLETVVSELELLCADTAVSARSDLIELHAALLVYELNGQAERIPTVGFGLSGRRLLELRVTKAARRLSSPKFGVADPDAAVTRAAALIEDLIHLIDPELRVLAA